MSAHDSARPTVRPAGSPSGPTAPWSAGAVIAGRYEVCGTLGEGGFGRVDLVRHLGWDQMLAVKSPHPWVWAGGPGAVAAFLDEARIWVDLPPHAHLCTCHYVQVVDGAPRMFAEYAPGGSLVDLMDAGPLPLPEILDLAVQTARGLAAAHAVGVAHRDVKPRNVLLAADGTAKVTDFGLATARGRVRAVAGPGTARHATLATQNALTPAYAAPEQLAGGRGGRRSDVWSWAVSVLEMFVGHVAWATGPEAGRYLAALRRDRPAAIPTDVAALLQWCLADAPTDRPDLAEAADVLVAAYAAGVGTPYPRPAPDASSRPADGLNNKALSLLDLGEGARAELCWAESLRLDPRHLDATYNRGLARWRDGRQTDVELVDALEAARAVAADQDRGRAAHLLAAVHRERGDVRAARDVIAEAARRVPGDAELAVAHSEVLDEVDPVETAVPVGAVVTALDTGDGHVLFGFRDGRVGSWSLTTAPATRTMRGHGGEVTAVALAAGALRGVSGGTDHTVRVWDLATGRCRHVLAGHTHPVVAVAVTPDGRQVLSVDQGGSLRRWDLRRWRPRSTARAAGVGVTAAALLAEPPRALIGGADGSVRWWDPATGDVVAVDGRHATAVSAAALDPHAGLAASADLTGTIHLRDPETGAGRRTLAGHRGPVRALATGADGHLLSAGDDGTVRCWDTATGRCRRTFGGHAGRVLATAADRHRAASGGDDATFRTWDLSAGPAAPVGYSRPRSVVELAAGAAEFARLIGAARDLLDRGDPAAAAGRLRIARAVPGFARHPDLEDLWRRTGRAGRRTALRDVRCSRVVGGRRAGGHAVAMTPDAGHVLLVGTDHALQWWDLAAARCVHTLAGHTADVLALAVTPDGRHAVSGGLDRTVRVWDLVTGRCRGVLTGHSDPVVSVAVTAGGGSALSGGGEGTLRHWDLAGNGGHVLDEPEGTGVLAVAFTADGRYALSAGQPRRVCRWDLDTGDCVTRLGVTGAGYRVTSLATTPDGRHALFGRSDARIDWWDLEADRRLRTLDGQRVPVRSVAVTPDGRHGLSTHLDRTVGLWDLTTGHRLHTLDGGGSAAVSADAQYLATGDTERGVRLWELSWEYVH